MVGQSTPGRVRFGCSREDGSDSGMVTAEFAVVLPAVMALAILLLALTQTVRIGMICQDTANAAAREVVIHQGKGDPTGLVSRMAGGSSELALERSGRQVQVTLSCPVVSTPLGALPPHIQGRAVAILEE